MKISKKIVLKEQIKKLGVEYISTNKELNLEAGAPTQETASDVDLAVLKKLADKQDALESVLSDANKKLQATVDKQQEQITNLNIAISQHKNKTLESKYSDGVIKMMKVFTAPKDKSIGDLSKELGLRSDTMPNSLVIPTEFVNELLKEIFNETDGETITSLVNTARVNSKNVIYSVQQSTPVATRVKGECANSNCSFPEFHTQELRPARLSACVEASWEWLNWQDSYTVSEITADINTAFQQQRAYEIINGTGNTGANTYNEYLGVLSDNRIIGANSPNITDSLGATVGYKDILAMLTNLQAMMGANQDAAFVMNKDVWLQLATEESTEGMPKNVINFTNNTIFGRSVIVTGDIAVADYDTIVGERVKSKIVPLMPEITAGSTPVILGNFKRGYKEIIASDMTVIRDDITGASGNCIKWFFHMYSDAMAVLPDAFNVLKMSA